MTQDERLDKLICYLLREKAEYKTIPIPDSAADKRRLLRALMNVRPPVPVSEDFLKVQDEYLQGVLAEKEVIRTADLTPVQPGLYLWQGDITTLAADAIVNAANSAMLGCFVPCHGCIAGMCAHHGAAAGGRTDRQGKNHAGLQSSVPLCAAYRRPHYRWAGHQTG